MVTERLAFIYCTAGSLAIHAALGVGVARIPLASTHALEVVEVSLVEPVTGTGRATGVDETIPTPASKKHAAPSRPSAPPKSVVLSTREQSAPRNASGSSLATTLPAPTPPPRDTLDLDLPDGIHEPNPTSPNLGPTDVRSVSVSRRREGGMAPGDMRLKGALSGIPLEEGARTGDGQGEEEVSRLTFREAARGPLSPAASAAQPSIVEGHRLPKQMLPVRQEQQRGQPAQRGVPTGDMHGLPGADAAAGSDRPAGSSIAALPALSGAVAGGRAASTPDGGRRESAPGADAGRNKAPGPGSSDRERDPSRQEARAGEGSPRRVADPEERPPLELEDVVLAEDAAQTPAPPGETARGAAETAAMARGPGTVVGPAPGGVDSRRSELSIWLRPARRETPNQKPGAAVALGRGRELQDRATRPHLERPTGLEHGQGEPGRDLNDRLGAVKGGQSAAGMAITPEQGGVLPAAPSPASASSDDVRSIVRNQSSDRYDLARQLQAHLPTRLATVAQRAAESAPPPPPRDVVVGQVAQAPQAGAGATNGGKPDATLEGQGSSRPDATDGQGAPAASRRERMAEKEAETSEKPGVERGQGRAASGASGSMPPGASTPPETVKGLSDATQEPAAVQASPAVSPVRSPSLVSGTAPAVPAVIAPGAPVVRPGAAAPADRAPAGLAAGGGQAVAPPLAGRPDGVAERAEPTRNPGVLPPGQEGGGPVTPLKPGFGGAARSGERARAVHSAEMQTFLSRCGINPDTVDPGEILDLDARETEYFDYLLKVRRALDEEFQKHPDAETALLKGRVQLVIPIDRKGRVRREDIVVSFNPGKPVLVELARDTAANARLPRIPAEYGRNRLIVIATFRFGVNADEVTGPVIERK